MGLADLLFQSAAVGAGAFFVGTAPLWFTSIASGTKLKITSTFGKGLLVGAALTVIIPEGVSTLYAASGKGHASHTHSLATVTSTGSKIARRTGPSTNSLLQINTLPPAAQSEPVLLRSRDDDDDDDKDNDDDDEDDDDRSDPSSTVGLSLISGFVLMLLIEQWTHSHNSPGDSAPAYARQQSTLPLLPSQQADGGGDWHRLQRRASTTGVDAGDLADEEEGRSAGGSPPITPRMDDVLGARDWREVLVRFPKSASATFALVVHSIADGIALGASARSGESDLGLVVFLAIMIHKIPASVGLCTNLLADGLPQPLIRLAVGAFALAAPLGAFLTYFLVNLVGRLIDDVALQYWTGVALTFSGGTFLYVATVIQDINPPSGGTHKEGGEAEVGEIGLGKQARLGLLVGGMVTPFILSMAVHGD